MKSAIILFFIITIGAGWASAYAPVIKPGALRCEYRKAPLGIDTPKPRFSWQLDSGKQGTRQSAYQMVVEGVWDSGKVDSSSTSQIRYNGKPLVSCTSYRWKVRVWDQHGKVSPWSETALWTMGIMSPDEWRAKWIRSPGNKGGNNDADLNGAKWIWTVAEGGTIEEPPVGSCLFSRRFQLERYADVLEAELNVAADSHAVVYVNGTQAVKTAHWQTGETVAVKELLVEGENELKIFAFNEADTEKPAGVVCSLKITRSDGTERSIISDKEWSAVIKTVRTHKNHPEKKIERTSIVSEIAPFGQGPWSRQVYFGDTENPRGLPVFRKRFEVNGTPRKAFVNVSGLGQYELFVNGEKVGDHVLSPPWSVYEKTVYYNMFDITGLLKRGENEFKIMLGKGFYNTLGDRIVHHVNTWGELMTILEAHIEYSDGSKQTVVTDRSWDVANGPVVHATTVGGSDYNAAFDQPSEWGRAVETQAAGVLRGVESPAMKAFERLAPVKAVEEPEPGVFVYDFGQNLSAVPCIQIRGRKGQTVRVIPAEQRHSQSGRYNNGTGRVNQAGVGSPNYYEYTLKGDGTERWSPQFTYGGFQYLEVVGAVPEGRLNPDDLPVIEVVESVHVRSSARRVGDFSCSNPLFVKIDKAIDRAVRSNLAHVLTDCPTREKLGWLEVAYLMGPSLSRRYDLSLLYAKVMRDIRETQGESGAIYTTAPRYINLDINHRIGYTIEWGAAGVVLPWQLYRWYGDKRVLRENFQTMKAFVDHIKTCCNDLVPKPGLGDWFDYGHGQSRGASKFTPADLTAMATFYRCSLIIEKSAEILGESDDVQKYRALAKEIRSKFNQTFYTGNGEYRNYGSPQTANAIALVTGLCEPQNERDVLHAILADLEKRNYQQTAGDVGFHYLVEALGRFNCHKTVCTILNRRDLGSYGFMIDRGWSALPESWDAATNESMNHCMLGHIQQWFYMDLIGIKQAEDSVAFKKIIIKPQTETDLEWAEGYYDSINGRIVSKWKNEADRLTMEVTIPANSTATVYVPTHDVKEITVNGAAVADAPYVQVVKMEDGRVLLNVQSGRYEIVATRASFTMVN
ncbi:family 78 glycoside hydrolase catalytic domain [Pontiella desulfatans]|nr:family 78 glycoside hydrolase catalytic domain [Pontiella desulfatans]